MAFTLPELPYAYDALEPHYDAKTVEIHHSKHHKTYTDKLNAAVEAAGAGDKTIEEIIVGLNDFPQPHQTPLRNHSGGYWNHTFFWESMAPNPNSEERGPSGALADAINADFGSLDDFKKAFNAKAAAHFGSGWAWLVKNKEGKLEVIDTHDQVCPLTDGYTPLLTIDVWEHAYYLKFKNVRPDWIAAWWNIVNWEKVEERFNA